LAIAGSLVSVGAQAGQLVTGYVSFVPTNVGVPTLSNSMLVLLGVLMAVIAVRVIRSGSGAMNRLAGAVLVIGGVISSGYGIDSTLASGSVTVSGSACTTGDTRSFPPNYSNTFFNECSTSVSITSIELPCQEPVTGTCKVGGVVGAKNSCLLPYCDIGK
jgi:hypothetical protein